MIRFRREDIYGTDAEVIAVVGNYNAYLAGVSKALSVKYPEFKEGYINNCEEKKAQLFGHAQLYEVKDVDYADRHIANLCIIARDFNSKKYRVFTDFLREALEELVDEMRKRDMTTVAIPYGMGCNRGGADWDEVMGILEEVFVNENPDMGLIICAL